MRMQTSRPPSLSVHIFSSIHKDNALPGSYPICSAVWHYRTVSFEEVLTAARSRITALLAHCLTAKLQHPFSKLFVFHFCPVFRLSSLVKLCAERCFMTNSKPWGSALIHQGEESCHVNSIEVVHFSLLFNLSAPPSVDTLRKRTNLRARSSKGKTTDWSWVWFVSCLKK